jgi:hypothetical protein
MEELKDANGLLEEYVIGPYLMFNHLNAVSYYMSMDNS